MQEKYFLIPIYSFIILLMNSQYLYHILLIFRCFFTKIDLLFHNAIEDSFRHEKFIGLNYNFNYFQ